MPKVQTAQKKKLVIQRRFIYSFLHYYILIQYGTINYLKIICYIQFFTQKSLVKSLNQYFTQNDENMIESADTNMLRYTYLRIKHEYCIAQWSSKIRTQILGFEYYPLITTVIVRIIYMYTRVNDNITSNQYHRQTYCKHY